MYKLLRKLKNFPGTYHYKFRGKFYDIKIEDEISIYENGNLIFNDNELNFMFAEQKIVFDPEFIERLLQSFLTTKENLQKSVINPEKEDKPLADGLEQISEDFHGGNESTASVENSQSAFGDSSSSQHESEDKMAGIELENPPKELMSSPSGEGMSDSGNSQSGQPQPLSGQPAEQAGNKHDGSSSGRQSSVDSPNAGLYAEQNPQNAASHKEDVQDKRLSFDLRRVYHDPINQKPEMANGGGSQFAIHDEDGKVDARIAQCVERHITGYGVRKVAGYDHWWSKPVAKSILKKDFKKLLNNGCKYKRENEKIYICLDTSGSVDYLSEKIKKIIISCMKSNKIVVYTGSEAHPCYKEPYKEEKVIYNYDFHIDLFNFIRAEKPTKGSTIIFFGDLFGVHINVPQTKRLISGYRTIWICNREKGRNEWKNAEKCFNKVIYEVDSISKFIFILKNIL